MFSAADPQYTAGACFWRRRLAHSRFLPRHGLQPLALPTPRYTYAAHVLCNVYSLWCHQFPVRIFGCRSPVLSKSQLAPAPGPLSFSPTAWVAIGSPTPRYSTYDAHVYPLFIILAPVPKKVFFGCGSLGYAPGAAGACFWRRCLSWPIVVFSHGMGCNCFAYSKVILCCAFAFPLRHLGACSQVSIFGCRSLVSTWRSWRLLLAPAPGPLSFSPTAWAATASPTLRYSIYDPVQGAFPCATSWRLFPSK